MGSPADKKKRLLEIAKDLPAEAVERHFQRFDSDYWNEFPVEEIHSHVVILLGLTADLPHCARVESLKAGKPDSP
jgi:hypothetical protein